MITDKNQQLVTGQAVTADAPSTNSFDQQLMTPQRYIGTGEPMGIAFFITAIGTNTGSTKLQAITSAASTLSSPKIIGEVDLATADIFVGQAIFVPLPPSIPASANLRYLGGYHDITGTVDYTCDTYLMAWSEFSGNQEAYDVGWNIA